MENQACYKIRHLTRNFETNVAAQDSSLRTMIMQSYTKYGKPTQLNPLVKYKE